VIDLGLVAGEASGDLLGAHFISALKQAHLICVLQASRPQTIQAGVEAIFSQRKTGGQRLCRSAAHLPVAAVDPLSDHASFTD